MFIGMALTSVLGVFRIMINALVTSLLEVSGIRAWPASEFEDLRNTSQIVVRRHRTHLLVCKGKLPGGVNPRIAHYPFNNQSFRSNNSSCVAVYAASMTSLTVQLNHP